MSVKIQIKRANASAWTAANPTLAAGEWGMELDTKKLKLGTGALWNSTDYYSETLTLNSVGDVTITSLQNGDFLRYSSSASAWINDPVNLSTDTVGDYVQSLTAGTGVTLSNNSGEGATPTVAIGQAVGTSASVTFGQLTVNGQTNVGGNVIPDTNEAYDLGSASARFRDIYLSGTTINLGGAEITSNGTDISFSGGIGVSGSANFVGDLTGNADTATTLETSRAISLAGDLSGSASFDGSTNITITATVQPDSIALGTDTTGDYVATLTAGTGITLANNSGENASPTVTVDTTVIQARVTNVTDTEIGYLDGVTSAIQTQMDLKAPLASPTFTGTVTLPSGTVTSAMILDETIVNADISASAAIADTKLATISTASKVSNSATTATNANTASAIVARDASGNFAAGTVTAALSGNASTASTLETARTISISGDVSGSVSFNGSSAVDISATIQPNSVSLGTDTTGNYVNDVTAGTGVSVTHTPGEGSSPTIAIGQDVATSASVTFARLDTTGNVVIGGNLTVNGDTTTLNTETLSVEDNTVVLNSNATGSPTLNAGIEVERGDSANVSVRWNESSDSWELTEDGSTYKNIAVGQDVETSASVQFVAVTAELVGNSSTSSALKTPRTIALSGDVSGSVSFDGSANVDITATVQPNSVALGTDTTGNYVNDVTAGTGVTVTHTPGEGTSPTIAIGQAVGTSASVTFANVTADLVGDVTGNSSTATTLETSRTISLTGDVSGSVSFNGSSDASIAATIQPNSVALGTDTTGNYVNDLTAGTGVTVTHTPGEGSSPTIAIGQAVGTSASVTFAHVSAPVTGNVTGDVTGSSGSTTGNAATATALQNARVIALTGDVSGSVSFDGTGNVDISTTIGANSVALGSDTSGDYVSSLVAGTGVTLSNNSGETATPTVAIGQAVGTSASVTFAKVDTTGDVTVGGNLTVNGTTTTLNTETLAVEDNIVVLNSNVTGSPATNAGIEVERGDSTNVVLRWNESNDKWETTNDGSTYSTIATNGNIALGTDTTGNYVNDLTAGTGVSVTHTPGEGSSPTVAIGQAVGTSASVTFAAVTAPVIGNASTASALETTRTISLTGDMSGSVSFNGSADASISATIQPNSVSLGTDTTGNYVNDLTAGTGVTVTHTPGEGSSPTVAIGQAVGTSSSVTFAAVTAPVTGNVTGDVTGNAGTATALQTSRAISLGGDLSGSVSFNGTSDVTITATVQPDSVALGTDTTGNYMSGVTAGTGITVTHTPGEGSSATIAIGQAVGASDNPSFAGVTADGVQIGISASAEIDTTAGNLVIDSAGGTVTIDDNLVVSGDLTVNGTTTTVNTETINLADNLIVLNSNETSAPSQNAGIEIERGSSNNVALRWNETSDKWEVTEDGSTYVDIATVSYVDGQTINTLDDISDVSTASAASGDFLKWNGSAWVNDPINLGSDTVGNYVNDITAGTGVTVTHTPGEGSSPTVAIGQAVGTSSSVTFAAVTAPLIGNVTGNADTATALATSRTIELTGDVTGSVSFNGSANASITATIAANSVALGTDTTGNYMSALVAGTGITVTHTPGEGSSASVALNATLDDLSNVDAASPSVDDFLKWDGTKWVPDAVVFPPSINALDDIADVNAPSPTTGHFLKWDGTEWVPAAAGGAVTTTTISANTETTVATFSKTEAESAEFIVKVKQGERRFSDKVLVLHNGTTADFTDFGELSLAATEAAAGTGAVTWVTQTSNFGANESILSVAYGNNLWVAGGTNVELHTSTDAITWTTRTSNFTDTITSVAYGNNLWVAVGTNAELRTSTDAITWTTRTSNFGAANSILSVAFGNNLWVAGGAYGELRTSTDAVTWTTRTSNFGAYDYVNSVAYGNNLWVIGGSYGEPRTSTDGITWVTRTSNFGGYNIYSVAYGDNLWVIGGTLGNLNTSTDGTTWTSQTSNFDSTRILSVAYGNNLWVAGGRDGQIRSSTDAVTWVTRNSNFGAYDYVNSVAYGNSLWVAAGDYANIRTSAAETGAFYVGGGSVSASVSFATDISGSDVRLRMTIPDAGSTSAIVKVLTTKVGES